MKSLVGTELEKVSSVGEKLFDAERELRIEGVLQFLRRHSNDPTKNTNKINVLID